MLISPGELMYTDFFKWQGQFGTATWQENLSMYDCTTHLSYFFDHVPVAPVIETPTIIFAPTVFVDPVDTTPIVQISYDPPPVNVAATPELSTWIMVLLGMVVITLWKGKVIACVPQRIARLRPSRAL